MNILALDTSTSTLHLALKTDSGEECIMKENFQHSEGLLNEIVILLERHDLEIKDLDLLVCTRGPGSFTSLRIGMATLKGFSEALGTPLVSVPTLQAIAACHSQKDIITLAVIDAKKKRYYLGIYRNGEAVCSDVDGNIDAILSFIEKEDRIIITGPDAPAFEQIVHSHLSHLKTEADSTLIPLGLKIAELGLDQYRKAGADDIGQGPVYIRRSDAEEALLQKKNGEIK